ncbi:MAG: hybrid sensor histidine kinase/response regulator [Pseudanabaena sp. ELA607]
MNSHDQATILVIDDEPDNFDVVEAILNNQPYQLHYAAAGHEALDMLDLYQPDLILLDVMMPEMDGIEVCKVIKSQMRWRNIPIIIVTALTAREDLAQCLAVGADDFISKPLNSLELRARINSMLRIKKQYDTLQRFSLLQRDTINILGQNLHELTGNLASKLSHELNTPLNGIIGVIELLRHNIDTMNMAEIKETLSWADESAQLLFSLTKKFRTYLQLEILAAEGKTFSHEWTELDRDVVISELKPYFDKLERSEDLVYEIEDGQICLPEHYLCMLIRELAENALKFSKAGTEVSVKSKLNGNMMEITIHDYGRGMKEKQIARIDALVQFERQTYAQDGLGMGLKIVQRIIELAGGKFKISSIYQQETLVLVTIPLAVVP